eukprot:SAG11_NODE_113_length_16061_cov_16.161143_2_plen_88_part_00
MTKTIASCPRLFFIARLDNGETQTSALIVVHLETHPIMDLVVFQRDVVLVDCVPLLDPNLLSPSAYASTAQRQLNRLRDPVVSVAKF